MLSLRKQAFQKFSDFAPGGSDSKEPACNAGNPWVQEDTLEQGMAMPSSIFCLENSRNRGAWWATVHGVEKSWT